MKILLCIDDDPVLEEVLFALEWSLDLSRPHHIVPLHVLGSRPLVSTSTSSDLHPRLRAEALLDRVGQRLSLLGIRAAPVLSSGDAPQEIVRIADECEADLIILGARGERRDFLMGSVSQKVASLAPTDVLVVREASGFRPARDLRSSFRALVAVDGSLGSEAGIEAFAGKLRAQNAVIRVVHVVDAIPALWNVARDREVAFFQSMESRALQVLSRAKRLLENLGLESECEWRRGSPAAQILDSAAEAGADLIVVGSRGHSAIRDMMLGGVTHRVLRHAPCTVLCARGWALESSRFSRPWSSELWEPGVGMA